MNDPRLARARQEIAAARLLARSGFPAQAVSRSYYAAFHAAETALLELGETRSKHGAVVAAFIRLVVLESGADRETGRLIRSLFERRGQADYSDDEVPQGAGERAVVDAEAVVNAVDSWLAARA